MGMSVLLGRDIYNVEELVQQKDVLTSLQGTPNEWLYEVLMALASGDIQRFESTAAQYNITQHAVVAKNKDQLDRKIRIMAFLDLIFHRNKGDRTLSFEEIAQATGVSLDDVELLVIKAMSIGLVRGQIDQVDQTVAIDWVQPRVLSKDKIKVMLDKLGQWKTHCEETFKTLEDYAEELIQI